MGVLISSVIGTVTISAFLLHLIGSFLLWKTYKWERVTTQQLLIFHLSVCECIINGNWIIMQVLEAIWDTVHHRYCFVVYLALSGVLYKIIMFITIDRLIAVLLHLKYPQYWTVQKTRIALIFVWAFGIVLTLCFIICNKFLGYWYRAVEVAHIKMVFSLCYTLVALITYVVIFLNYKKSRSLIHGRSNRSSRFYVAVLIIFSYLLFNTIPFCTFAISDKDYIERPSPLEAILLHLGDVADATIYIFFAAWCKKEILQMDILYSHSWK